MTGVFIVVLCFLLLELLVGEAKSGSTYCRVTTENGSSRLSTRCEVPVKADIYRDVPAVKGINGEQGDKGSWKLYVDDMNPRQKIMGFGAAWTDATVSVFDALNGTAREELMRELFDSSNSNSSLGLTLMRHTIGQSDLTPPSIGEWSYDNTTDPDVNLTHFSLMPQGTFLCSKIQKKITYSHTHTRIQESEWYTI